MILAENEITSVIPHREPFVMIGSLLSVSAEAIESNFTIKADNILSEEGKFSFPGLIENIAQTCAAGFGYLDQQKGSGPKLGFIGAISKLKTFNQALVGETIHTKIETVTSFNNVVLIKGANFVGEKLLMECEMKIVIVD